jgi:hypothetical protein
MALLFFNRSSPDSDDIKKTIRPAVRRLVKTLISAVISRLIEIIDAFPFKPVTYNESATVVLVFKLFGKVHFAEIDEMRSGLLIIIGVSYQNLKQIFACLFTRLTLRPSCSLHDTKVHAVNSNRV